MCGELTGTLTGDIVCKLSDDLVDSIFTENAKCLKGEIVASLAIDNKDETAGTSLGHIVTNRVRVMAKAMGVDHISRRDAMMALAGVFAVKDEMKISKMGEVLK